MSKHCIIEHKSKETRKPKNEYIRDIKTQSKPQLLEQLDRQNKLISSSALTLLKDKGEKVNTTKKRIEEELDKRNKSEDIVEGLNKLSVNEKNIEAIEWGEKNIPHKTKWPVDEISEDEKNPFAILASHSGTTHNKKIIKVEEQDEEPLVSLTDIEDVYSLKLSNKIDNVEAKTKFLPHKSLIQNPTDVITKQQKTRDNSAATPPAPIFGDTKLISLHDSIRLQYDQSKNLKEVQLKHATERLRGSKINIGISLPSGENSRCHRDPPIAYSEEGSEQEQSDGEDE